MTPQDWHVWLKQANADLQAARDLMAGGDHFWCCFTCHQAAEVAVIKQFRG